MASRTAASLRSAGRVTQQGVVSRIFMTCRHANVAKPGFIYSWLVTFLIAPLTLLGYAIPGWVIGVCKDADPTNDRDITVLPGWLPKVAVIVVLVGFYSCYESMVRAREAYKARRKKRGEAAAGLWSRLWWTIWHKPTIVYNLIVAFASVGVGLAVWACDPELLEGDGVRCEDRTKPYTYRFLSLSTKQHATAIAATIVAAMMAISGCFEAVETCMKWWATRRRRAREDEHTA
ncbi:hypothetical protein JCM10213_000612 [Rhodosporidiobolus nylandii]